MIFFWASIVWIVLHTVDGNEITIDPEDIAVMRETSEAAKGTPNQIIVTGVHCVIGMSNGKYISVIETCAAVRGLVEQSSKLK